MGRGREAGFGKEKPWKSFPGKDPFPGLFLFLPSPHFPGFFLPPEPGKSGNSRIPKPQNHSGASLGIPRRNLPLILPVPSFPFIPSFFFPYSQISPYPHLPPYSQFFPRYSQFFPSFLPAQNQGGFIPQSRMIPAFPTWNPTRNLPKRPWKFGKLFQARKTPHFPRSAAKETLE